MMRTIIEIDRDLNNWYRSSKLPIVLKIFICRYKRYILSKKIERYVHSVFSVKDIIQFLYYAMNASSIDTKDRFMYLTECSELNQGEELYAKIVWTSSSNNTYYFTITIHCSNLTMDITAKVKGDNKTYRKFYPDVSSLDTTDIITIDKIQSNIFGILNGIIGEMIGNLLMDIMKRSERIYEYDKLQFKQIGRKDLPK